MLQKDGSKRSSSYLCSLISSVWKNRKSLVCKEDEKASGQKSQDVLQVENEEYLVAIWLEKTQNYIPQKNVPLTKTQGRESLGSLVSALPMIKYCFFLCY